MLRLYGAQRRRGGPNPYGVSPINLGDVLYLQDRVDRYGGPVFRNPWMVVGFLNRQYHPAVKGAPPVVYLRGDGGVIVRSLRDGREQVVGAHACNVADDEGWVKEWGEPLPVPLPIGYAEAVPWFKAKRARSRNRKAA